MRLRALALATCLATSVAPAGALRSAVRGTQPLEAPRDRLGRQVRDKLFGDPQLLGSGSITVIVDGRRVILEGWVSSVNERTLAEADAVTVAGVATVDNRLVVRGIGAGSK